MDSGFSSLIVNISIHIMSVLNVNENENFIKFVYAVRKEWYNSYLNFQHLKVNDKNVIFANDRKSMWIPWLEAPNLENRDKCAPKDKKEIIRVDPMENFNHEYSPYTEPNNAFLFKGSENKIIQEAEWSCEQLCKFEYNWYPFDAQNCYILLNDSTSSFKIIPIDIQYKGSEDVGRYYFHSINYCDRDRNGNIGLQIDFIIRRPVLNNLITLYLPTGMLLLISQLSTAFSKSFRELVIEVNTTLLLVLTT